MNTRQFYRALFLNDDNNADDFLHPYKSEYKFRGILRALNASAVEKKLYGNNTDTSFWTPDFYPNVIFKKLNNQYRYLKDTEENQNLFRYAYYIFYVLNLRAYASDNAALEAYQLLVYFGHHKTIEKLLEVFDTCSNYACGTNNYFPPQLTPLTTSIQLPLWQKLIEENLSHPENLLTISMAELIEKKLHRAPNTIDELIKTYESLLREEVLNHEELLLCLHAAHSDKLFEHFVTAINGRNLNRLIRHDEDFNNIISSLHDPAREKKLLDRFSDKALRELVKYDEHSSLKHYSYLKMLRLVHSNNTTYLIQRFGTEIILRHVGSAYQLSHFIKMELPYRLDRTEFLTNVLSTAKLQSFIQDGNDILILLVHIKDTSKLHFLLNSVGKEKCSTLLSTTPFQLCNVLDQLNFDEQISFIKAILTQEQLKEIRASHGWEDFKSRFPRKEDKAELNKLIYSEEDLAAKATLKNIKHHITERNWQPRMFNSLVSTNVGRKMVDIPRTIFPHLDEIRAAAFGKKSPSEALNELRKQGEIAAKDNQKMTKKFKHFLFAKSEEEKYFEQFSDAEKFNDAFVVKKKM